MVGFRALLSKAMMIMSPRQRRWGCVRSVSLFVPLRPPLTPLKHCTTTSKHRHRLPSCSVPAPRKSSSKSHHHHRTPPPPLPPPPPPTPSLSLPHSSSSPWPLSSSTSGRIITLLQMPCLRRRGSRWTISGSAPRSRRRQQQ